MALPTPAPTLAQNGIVARRTPDATANVLGSTLDSIDLRNFWGAVWRWRGVVMWTTLILTGLSFLVIRSLTPQYTASAQVLVGVDQIKVGELQALISDLKGGGDISGPIATEIGVIRSRKIAENTIAKLNLQNDAEFNADLRPPTWFQRLMSGQHIIPQSWLGIVGDDKAAGPAAGDDPEMTKIVNVLENDLRVSNDGHSRIITISVELKNPRTSALVANTIADNYIVAGLDAKFETTKRANVWLADRLNTLREEVQVSENAVEKFRNDNGLLQAQNPTVPGTEGMTLAMQQMSQISADAITAHTKFLEAQSRLAELQRSGATRGGSAAVNAVQNDSILEVLQSPTIQNLRAQEADAERRAADLGGQFGDKYPRVISARAEVAEIRARIQAEVNRVIDALRNEVSTQQAREQDLNNLLAKMKTDAARNDIAEVQLHDLERQADADKTLYQNFLNQFKQTQSQDSFQQPDAEVLSRAALPLLPSFPQTAVLTLLCAGASFMLGIILALVFQYLDVGVRSMEQLKNVLHVHALGMVPAPQGMGRGKLAREVIDRPMSSYSEAIRTIHTNLMLSDVDQRPRVVLVTSSLPGEGKSTLSVSLAEISARYGQKVVVVDADLRRPSLHRLATVTAKPGLVDWLLDRVAFDEILQRHALGGVDVIAAGELPTVPPNLLSSERFKQLLRGLGEQYDLVVIDSAPVLALPDTRVLSMLADKTVFVVRWASTSRRVAAAALQQLDESGGFVAGAVLTAVDMKAHAKDGFYDSVLYSGQLKEYYR